MKLALLSPAIFSLFHFSIQRRHMSQMEHGLILSSVFKWIEGLIQSVL